MKIIYTIILAFFCLNTLGQDYINTPNGRIELKTVKNLYLTIDSNKKPEIHKEKKEKFYRTYPFFEVPDGTYQAPTGKLLIKLIDLSDTTLLHGLGKSYIQNEFDSFIYEVELRESESPINKANRLHEVGIFEWVEPDFIRLLKPKTTDTYYDNQWVLENTGSSAQFSGIYDADMDIPEAWSVAGMGSPDIKVAIIDEGVDLNHEDLQSNVLNGYDATGNGSFGAPNPKDAHGTACAGIVSAIANNNKGIAGIAPNCKILPVRIAYSTDSTTGWVTSTAWISNGINWAWQNGADVLSNSWGGGSESFAVNNAIDNATINGRNGLGSPVFFAAGNSNSALVGYPANRPNVIAVAAMSMCNERKSTTSCDGETWWGSNYGLNLDVATGGVKIVTTDIMGNGGYSSDNYVYFNGTSSACPNAAGVMALLLSAQPNLSYFDARIIFETNCSKVGNYTYYNNANQPNGTWSEELGYGMINAFKVIQAVTPSFPDDVALSDIERPKSNTCGTISPKIGIKNFGSNVLTSVIIKYWLDNQPINTYQWNGNLSPFSSELITLPTISVTKGNHTINVLATLPNGVTDPDNQNNQLSKLFYSVSDQSCPEFITLAGSPLQETTSCTGIVTDDGGSDGDYSNSQFTYLVIKGNGRVRLRFNDFNLRSPDKLEIYDAKWIWSDSLIGSYTGTILPNNGIIESTGKNITLAFTTNSAHTAAGFEIIWECFGANEIKPVSDFTVSNFRACEGEPTLFINNSLNNPTSYNWDFGDGTSSTDENPSHIYTSSGNYIVSLTACNTQGCDTTLKNISITLNSTFSTTIDTSICNGDSILINGTWVKSAGTYTETHTATNGCDSVITTNLSIELQKHTQTSTTICEGDFYNGINYFENTQWTDTFSTNGCDSLATTIINIIPDTEIYQLVEICEGDSFYVGGNWQHDAGTYYDEYLNPDNCDTTIITNLTVILLDDCGVCGGDNSTCTDCAGVVNGDAVIDTCGICRSQSSPDFNICPDPCTGIICHWNKECINGECIPINKGGGNNGKGNGKGNKTTIVIMEQVSEVKENSKFIIDILGRKGTNIESNRIYIKISKDGTIEKFIVVE